ncbi:MAG: hypothetical protein QXR81_05030 [Candidatus Nezhaarchaeales archaeon]
MDVSRIHPFGLMISLHFEAIDTAMIMLLVLDGYVWGVICEGCRRRYHGDKPLLAWNEYEEAMIRIGEPP